MEEICFLLSFGTARVQVKRIVRDLQSLSICVHRR